MKYIKGDYMNYFFKNIILGAGSLKLYPVASDYKDSSNLMLKMSHKKALEDNVSQSQALNSLFMQRYLGIFLMTVFIFTGLSLTMYSVIQGYNWFVTILPITVVWIVYPLVLYWRNKIFKRELDSH